MQPAEPELPIGWVDASAPHRRPSASRLVRRPLRRLRRWYRRTSTIDLVLTAVCLMGFVALVAAGLIVGLS